MPSIDRFLRSTFLAANNLFFKEKKQLHDTTNEL